MKKEKQNPELNRKAKILINPEYAEKRKQQHLDARKRWLLRNPEWVKAYNEKNREKLFKYRQQYRLKNLEKIKNYEAGRVGRIRQQTLDAYGRICVCCGETREPFLTVDHFDKDKGHKIMKRGYASILRGHGEYMRLKKLGWPPIVRIMCMNCNFAIRYNKPCPHEIERKMQESKGG